VPKYTGGDLSKVGALYIAPASISKNFPSEVSGKVAQLVSQLAKVANEVNGDKADPNMVTETKEGLLARADKLVASLNKIADNK
jgi:ribosome maturation protein Sdo1